jgi:acetyl-CoA carboxylase biotin carboxylase subunit
MFDRILIANRGEVAFRILRACREMGIEAVIIHSEADRDAGYVKLADLSLCIGPTSARRSYLNTAAILFAAEVSGAQAVHPGYGFLSENAEFAQQVEDAGIVFIGPSPQSIRTMGDKIAAKRAMIAANVPCIPGPDQALPEDPRAIEAIGESVGYPLIVKAGAGGGGRGMRVVPAPSELLKAVAVTREEARAAFGNPALYLEKFMEHPRHIEIQVLCDSHGNAVWLGDRDCSLQRRHQKVVEESPAPGVARSKIDAIGRRCVEACRQIGYRGVGTFEFLFEDDTFYFVEMNTRLQVEHPVTEMTSGVDIVQQQIAVAYGEPLRLTQEDIRPSGHAIECRINAEDPETFAPSPGRITAWNPPKGEGVRIDTHVAAEYVVPPYYDSLIAKLIVHAETREQAFSRMEEALADTEVEGLQTNIPLLRKIVADPSVRRGGIDVHFLEHWLAQT